MPSDEEVIERAGSLRAMTGVTAPEFTALLPYFERALVAYMADHTRDGHSRTNRRYRTYDTSALPPRADKLRCILTSVKQQPLQEVQGHLFGMSQATANQWLHLLHTVLNQALAQHELLPARTAGAWATLLTSTQAKEGTTSPLFGLMVLSAPSIARGSLKSRKTMTVARRRARQSKTSS